MEFLAGAFDWFDSFWRDWSTLIRIVLIIVGALVLRILLLLSVKRVVKGVISGARKFGGSKVASAATSPLDQARVIQRAHTMGSVLSNFIIWSIYIIGITMVLGELGVAVGALVAGAGILGAALGFGAQSLVRDLISGLFIVFEDQYGVGDSVDLGQATGVVESVGLRVTQVRDSAGTLWYVRNGEIIRVGNSSQGWSRVVLDIPLDYKADVDKATKAIGDAAAKLAKSKEFAADLIGTPEVWGIEALSGEQIVIRLAQQVLPTKQDSTARALRATIKKSLDSAGIELANGSQAIYVEVAGKAVK